MVDQNIVLIGMPSSGKSTIGKVLAQVLKRPFIDTDAVIEDRMQQPLSQLNAEHSFEAFKAIEEAAVCSVDTKRSVIATGGSVVYSSRAMEHLMQNNAIVVFIYVPFNVLEERVGDLQERGVILPPNQTFFDLYQDREKLYTQYATLRFEPGDADILSTVDLLIETLNIFG